MQDLTGSISGASGIMNFIINIVSNFISWVQLMPTFLKICIVLIGCSVGYVVYEFKYGIKQIPSQIQI